MKKLQKKLVLNLLYIIKFIERENCELYKMDYVQNLDYDGEASMYFLTHVDGSTGEILDVTSICKSLQHINVINTFSFIIQQAASLSPFCTLSGKRPQPSASFRGSAVL